MVRNALRRPVTRVKLGRVPVVRPDTLAVEEPLEIRVSGTSYVITMRTPGYDFDLAAGFLVSEGVIAARSDFANARYCAGATAEGVNTYNVVDVTLGRGVPAPAPELARNFYTTSSCGLCGKASIGAVRSISRHHVAHDSTTVSAERLLAFPERLREQQAIFDSTGGLHAAALFDNATGDLLVVREDVGRHKVRPRVSARFRRPWRERTRGWWSRRPNEHRSRYPHAPPRS